MVREQRYIIFKQSDVALLSVAERRELDVLAAKVRLKRHDAKKPKLECVVVEKDWPEYEPTWNAIAARVDAESVVPNE